MEYLSVQLSLMENLSVQPSLMEHLSLQPSYRTYVLTTTLHRSEGSEVVSYCPDEVSSYQMQLTF